jgi:hypothetical protein
MASLMCKSKLDCGRNCLPGMTVCVHHATKEAMAVQMRRLDDAAREALRLLDYYVGRDGAQPPLAARRALREALK